MSQAKSLAHDDTTHGVFTRAILVFVALALAQMGLAIGYMLSGWPAVILFVAALHNMLEYPVLGTMQRARQIDPQHVPSPWACYIGPLSPVWTATLALGVAALTGCLELIKHHELSLLPAAGAAVLELIDYLVNRRFVKQLHGLHDHHHVHGPSDRLGHAGERHLKGDAGFALCGVMAYLAIALTGPWWLDPIGAAIGLTAILYFNWEPIVHSLNETWQHRGHRGRHRLGQL